MKRFQKLPWPAIALSVVALAIAIGTFVFSGQPPLEALGEILDRSVGSPAAWRDTLRETSPLILAGLAVFVGLRAGLFNIGAEGQILMGAMVSVVCALRFPNLGGVLLGLVLGTIAGGLWAYPAGWIKAYRGGHEVISTIMLNYVAILMTGALVDGPLQGPDTQGSTTALLPSEARLPWLIDAMPFRLAWTIPMGVALTVLLWVWLRKRVAGYEAQAVGESPRAAAMAGIDVKRTTVRSMAFSGALAGLAGATQALAFEGRFYSDFSSGYGFDALGVAILAGSNPFGVLPAAFLFGALNKGTTGMQGVPSGVTFVLLGLLILAFSAYRYRPRSKDA